MDQKFTFLQTWWMLLKYNFKKFMNFSSGQPLFVTDPYTFNGKQISYDTEFDHL